ncbi:phosphoheptose isomerase [Clostridium folliculivorans]|uniref:Phosphoheptose isomerase n=1 Tax=Clostridium folliculivorans TaxID=2886038 RepID=A0A9W5Y5Z4_9CLOT|nr:D-sedoheptulose 7-phosphate isomerase [Clostridium folliculivorans]GKU27281.1 phosphoheptose isomerase [Clostridium folliculivorans]
MRNLIINQINESIEAKRKMAEDDRYVDEILKASDTLIEAFKNGNKVLICGNGGSAADAQHIVGEFVSKFRLERASLPAIALTTNTSIISAIGNDYEYNFIFQRQVEGLGKRGDVLIGISTSGNSANITRAFKQAKKMGIYTIALLGKDGGENKEFADLPIIVPSEDTPRVQESHIMIGHIICDIVEKTLFGEK